ncbi:MULTISPECIES: LysR family transcriptional regulator [unclassified Ensifer]|uniref:LysR family transcriptional regulator n=1 Tax=unclassified Ensifer TaxID=2633371 RepID=UPI0008139B6B|nr:MULTISPECIES: LysR family transcriptional regulator [unclassified Ensifer]OCP18330.1 transcriptional regulator [Ensifer sp. LC54]OCP27497.1 transcriptional regulator [Ensifer sp. LC384]OCP35279.1 transcriptional regulator [Ensifer sp. LC163]
MEEPALHLVQAFVAVVKHHSFAKAAQELQMTPSSVSRLVKTLERQVGVLLINRTTRAMSLTDAGQRYFSDSAAALEQLRQAHRRARDEQDLPSGTLKLSVSVSFGRDHVVPHLAAFLAAYPRLQLDLLMTDRYVDIVAEGVAVAIRIGTLPDSTLIARKLLSNRRILVAAPRYLEKRGVPAGIEALKQHECVVSTANHDGELWRLFGPEGEHTFRPQGRMRADNGDAVHQLAIDGQGIAFHSAVTMAESMRLGKLVQILPQWTGRETGVYCVFPSRHIGPAAKAFVDFLVTRWSGETRATLVGHLAAEAR